MTFSVLELTVVGSSIWLNVRMIGCMLSVTVVPHGMFVLTRLSPPLAAAVPVVNVPV